VPADTLDIPRVFLLSLSSAEKFRLSARMDQEGLCKIFRIPLCQLTDQRSVVGEHLGKLRKEKGLTERKKERKRGKLFLLTQSIKLRIRVIRTDICEFCLRNCYL
jgi:hypothetical protein